ncbi:16880_t:CDS:2, partial [Racocetra fulgida]
PIWKLAESLLAAFQLPDPTTHELFANTMELNKTGYSHLSSCYMEGINRQNSLYRQEILKVETKVIKGKKRKYTNSIISKTITNNNNESEKKQTPSKRIRRPTSNSTKEILSQLLT